MSFINKIRGLLPTLDRRKVSEPFVVEGANFYVDANGPVSGFGRTIIGYERLISSNIVQSFRVKQNSETFILTDIGVFTIDADSRRLVPQLLFSAAITSEFPWSVAHVGGKHYFARQGSDLLEYDGTADTWTVLTGGSIPTNIYAVTESFGRLVALSDDSYAWSAIDDGTDFTPSTSTGAGSQSLAIIGSGCSPLGIHSVADGFIVYTTCGSVKARAVNSVVRFNHNVMTEKRIPINPFCLIEMDDDQHVMLTKTGFFKTVGQNFEPWQTFMGEYFHRNLLPNFDLDNNQNSIRLYTDFDRSWFLVSISQSQQDYIYDYAYVLYLPVNEWGILNASHKAFGDFNLTSGPLEGFNFGFIDLDGTFFRFDDTASIETAPDFSSDPFYIEYIPSVIYPARYEDVASNEIKAPSVLTFRTTYEEEFSAAGFYDRRTELSEFESPDSVTVKTKTDELDSGTSEILAKSALSMRAGIINTEVVVIPRTTTSLDAYIRVGLLRYDANEFEANRLSYITNLVIHMLSSSVGAEFEDWGSTEQYPSDVYFDWLTGTGEEDWGAGFSSTTEYSVDMISTIDGYNEFNDDGTGPTLVDQEGRTRYLSLYKTGVYHILEISARDESENFHLRAFEVEPKPGGRING